MDNKNVGGVFLTVGLDASGIGAQAQAIAAEVNRTFQAAGGGGVGQKLQADLRAAGEAGVAGAQATNAEYAKVGQTIDRVSAGLARIRGPQAGDTVPLIQPGELQTFENMLKLRFQAVDAIEQERKAEQRSLNERIEARARLRIEAINAAQAEAQAAERAAQQEIAAQQRVAESRQRYLQQQNVPTFGAMTAAGFHPVEAALGQMIADRKKLTAEQERSTAQQIKDRDRNIASAKREAAEIAKAQKQQQEAFEQTKRQRSQQALTGISQAAFGASLAANGNALSGAALAASGFRQAISAIPNISAGAATGIAAMAAATVTVTSALSAATKATVSFIGTIVESAEKLETQAVSFTTLTGSVSTARQEFEKIAQIGIRSPFDIEQIAEMDKFLLAANIGSTKLRHNLVQSITDIGAAFGFSADRLQLIAVAVSQVQAAGRVTGDEGRQLRNQMIPIVEALKLIPKYANESSASIKKMIEEGKVSAREGEEAIVAFGQQFAGAAAQQANTVSGLIQNIKEAFTTAAGVAFGPETFGGLDALQPIRNFLIDIRTLVQTINWAPLASAVKNVFGALTGSISNATGDLSFVGDFFETTLPNAINTTAAVIQPLFDIITAVGQSFANMFPQSMFDDATKSATSFGATIEAVLMPLKMFATAVIFVSTTTGAAFDLIYGAAKALVNAIKGIVDGLWAIVVGAAAGIVNLISNVPGADTLLGDLPDKLSKEASRTAKASENAFNDVIPSFTQGFKDLAGTIDDGMSQVMTMWNSHVALPPLKDKLPKPEPPDWLDTFFANRGDIQSEIDSIIDEQNKVDEENRKKLEAAAKRAAEKKAQLLHQLAQMATSWFGERSQLAKGMLGDEGFTASVDQIASTAKQLADIMADLGRQDMVDKVVAATEKLIALAKMRDALAEKLKDAEQKLQDAVKARDDFIRNITDSSIAFVNALKQDEEKVREVIKTSTGWIVVEKTRTKNFVQGLRDRLAALKKFIGQIRGLAARGLDKELLKQLVQAGPEQAGTVVDELSSSGDDVLAEVNDLQRELKGVAEDYGTEVGREFYESGVIMAFNLVVGLQSQQAQVTAAAQRVFDALIGPVTSIANAGTLAGKGFGNNFATGVEDGLKRASRSLGGFQVAFLDTQDKSTPLEVMRANLQSQLTALRASPLAQGPALANLEVQLDNVERMLRALWAPWLMGAVAGKFIEPFTASPTVNVHIGGQKIHEIARAEVAYSNDQALMAVSAGTRH